MGLVRTKILALPRPLEKTLTDIADDLGVSRQYVHQIVSEESIPQYKRLKPLCKGCKKNRTEAYNRRYCPQCIEQNLHNRARRTGTEFRCCKCNKELYRRPSYIKRMKHNGKTYCYNCYMYHR